MGYLRHKFFLMFGFAGVLASTAGVWAADRNSQAASILAGASAVAGMSCVELMREASKEEDPDTKRWLRMMAMQQCSQASQFALGSQKNSEGQKPEEKKDKASPEDELKKFPAAKLDPPEAPKDEVLDKRLFMIDTEVANGAGSSVISDAEKVAPAAPLNLDDIKTAISQPVRTKGEVKESGGTLPPSSRTTLSPIDRKDGKPEEGSRMPASVPSEARAVTGGAKPSIGMGEKLGEPVESGSSATAAVKMPVASGASAEGDSSGSDGAPSTSAGSSINWKAMVSAASEARGIKADANYLEFTPPAEGERPVTIFDYVRFRYEYAAFKEKRIRLPQRRAKTELRILQKPPMFPRTISAKMPPY